MKVFASSLPWILLISSLLLDLLFQNLLPRLLARQNLRKELPSALLAPSCRLRPVLCAWTGVFSVASAFLASTLLEAFLSVSGGWSAVLTVGYALFAIFLAIAAFSPQEGERKRGGRLRNPKFHQDTASAAPFMLIPSVLALGILLILDGKIWMGVFSLLCCAAELFGLAAYLLASRPRFRDTWMAQRGLWLRLAMLFGYLHFCLLALNLLCLPG